MATLSSILSWRIPWTEEPGGVLGHKESDATVATGHACIAVSHVNKIFKRKALFIIIS